MSSRKFDKKTLKIRHYLKDNYIGFEISERQNVIDKMAKQSQKHVN